METKQAVLPLSAPVSTSILLCFGNRHNHITVFDETIFVSSMTLLARACWAQPKPGVLHPLDAGCAFVPNASIAKKNTEDSPQNGKNPRRSLFIGSALFPWWPFLLRRTSLHSSALSSVPASRPAPFGRLDKRLSSEKAV